jgi:hypothetical protein
MPKIHDAQPAALLRASRVAAGGLIDRRVFLRGGAVAGLALAGGWTAGVAAAPIGEQAHAWRKRIGAPMSATGTPSHHVESRLKRGVLQPYGAIAPGSGAS